MAELTLIEDTARDLTAFRRSPAVHLAEAFAAAEVKGARAVRVKEIPFQAMVGLRVEQGSRGAAQVEDCLGVALPGGHGQVTTGHLRSVLWLGPDEFLVVSAEDPADLAGRLAAALAGEPGSAIDLSANRTTFELAGPSARFVLEKGCAVDLHPRSFTPGTAVTAQVGPVPVLLWHTLEQTYRIYPRASFADFLGRWLLDAMAEFAAPEVP